ncbi:MAG TPA: PIN domain nuclease [Thermoanaerobaculia bacterium]|nr:PIN domain nuclease [Thermoanaerobaculia bacterium]
MFLVDSSVWILADRSRFTLSRFLPADEVVATCPMIAQEVLRGTRDAAHYQSTRRLLLGVEMLDESTPFERFETAAEVFLACRDAGITPRSSVDCLVVATALAYGVTLVHDDRDFEHIKRILPLKTLRVTPSSGSRS